MKLFMKIITPPGVGELISPKMLWQSQIRRLTIISVEVQILSLFLIKHFFSPLREWGQTYLLLFIRTPNKKHFIKSTSVTVALQLFSHEVAMKHFESFFLKSQLLAVLPQNWFFFLVIQNVYTACFCSTLWLLFRSNNCGDFSET